MAHDQTFYDYLFMFFAYSGVIAWAIVGYITYCFYFRQKV
jgi:hypothetical protein